MVSLCPILYFVFAGGKPARYLYGIVRSTNSFFVKYALSIFLCLLLNVYEYFLEILPILTLYQEMKMLLMLSKKKFLKKNKQHSCFMGICILYGKVFLIITHHLKQ